MPSLLTLVIAEGNHSDEALHSKKPQSRCLKDDLQNKIKQHHETYEGYRISSQVR